MKKENKVKQIVIRFDEHSYNTVRDYAMIEHRGIGEFVRHAALYYIEKKEEANKLPSQNGEDRYW